jgi:hypothetical protein
MAKEEEPKGRCNGSHSGEPLDPRILRIFDTFADQTLDGVITFKLAAFPQAAVLKTPHEGVVRMVDLPRIADHVHPHDVVVMKRKERLALHRSLQRRDWKPRRRE